MCERDPSSSLPFPGQLFFSLSSLLSSLSLSLSLALALSYQGSALVPSRDRLTEKETARTGKESQSEFKRIGDNGRQTDKQAGRTGTHRHQAHRSRQRQTEADRQTDRQTGAHTTSSAGHSALDSICCLFVRSLRLFASLCISDMEDILVVEKLLFAVATY